MEFQNLTRAVANNDPVAMATLGEKYEAGFFDPTTHNYQIDGEKALSLYQRSANLGFRDGMFGVGHIYENGTGVPRDSAKAFQYTKAAAELGHVRAIEQLAFDYMASTPYSNESTRQGYIWDQVGHALDSTFNPDTSLEEGQLARDGALEQTQREAAELFKTVKENSHQQCQKFPSGCQK